MLEDTRIGQSFNQQSFNQQLEGLLEIWSAISAADDPHSETSFRELQTYLQDQIQGQDNGQLPQAVFQVLVEKSFLGIALIQDFDLVYANPVLSEITGYAIEEMRAFSAEIINLALYGQDAERAWLRLVTSLATGKIAPRLELCFPQKDGSISWAEFFASSIFFQGRPAILVNCIDLTDRKKAELELEQLYARLELEVRERAEDLATANGALQAEVTERKQAQNALERAHSELEARVQQRTEELASVNQALKSQITERQKVEDALRQSEELFRSLSENASDIVSVISGDGKIRYESPSIKRVLGYEPEELIGQSVFDFSHIDDRNRVLSIINEAVEEPGTVHTAEFRFLHKDGSWRTLESIGKNLLGSPVVDGLVFNSRDITRRKEDEDERARLLKKIQIQHDQLRVLASRRRHLAQQVVLAQEEERYRVSRELHDEAGQALTALKVSLEMILSREDLEENSQVFKDLKKALHLTESTSAQIRSLAHNLRPAALDDLGLDLALEGFCHEFADRTQLAISYTGDEGIAMSDARGTCFYRLLQEALTNVAKHAQAQQVEVILACNSDEVSLSVIDDGLGFNLQPNLYNGKKPGIGLLGMQERLETLGGKLNIESGPDMGTRLVATLPIWPGNE